MENCIKAGKADQIDVTTDQGKWYESKLNDQCPTPNDPHSTQDASSAVKSKWVKFPGTSIPSMFNYGHIFHYIIETMPSLPAATWAGGDDDDDQDDIDGQSSTTAKPLRRGQQYVDSKYVSDLMDKEDDTLYYLKASVNASMISTRYSVLVKLSKTSGAVQDASCECKASSLKRCSHVSALLLYLSYHVKHHGYEPNLSCTEKLATWNKGKKDKNPSKVHEATYPSKKIKSQTIKHDPRPASQQSVTQHQINGFLSHLQQSGEGGMWQTLLKIEYSNYQLAPERKEVLLNLSYILHTNMRDIAEGQSCAFVVDETDLQVDSDVWHSHRWRRLTASTAKEAMLLCKNLREQPDNDKCGQRLRTFMRKNLWGLDRAETAYMRLGMQKEAEARQDYTKVLLEKSPLATVKTSGLWVNPRWPQLACSPDGLVYDPSEPSSDGLLEIKVLKLLQMYSVNELQVAVAENKVSKPAVNSACFKITSDGKLELRQSHTYHYQVQFQMAITSKVWCDFVLWSSKGKPSVQRIYRNEEIISELLTSLMWLWKHAVAPEVFEMRSPRELVPFVLF